MVNFTREEFVEHLGIEALREIFPLKKIFNLTRIKLDLMLNPTVAIQMRQFISVKKGTALLHFGLTVDYWLNDENDIAARIQQITLYKSYHELDQHRETFIKNEIKINQN